MFSNFIFNNIKSSYYGVYCCTFDSSAGTTIISDGSVTKLLTEKAPLSNKWYIYDSEYDEPIQFKIQIINFDNSDMTTEKRRNIAKWLCVRNEYHWFMIDDEEYRDIYFNVIISDPQVINMGRAIGMEFTVTCDSPFGYSELLKKNYEINTTNQIITIFNNSDEKECLYPKMKITMKNKGKLSIVNRSEIDHYDFELSNLDNREVVTIDNENGIIVTSSITHYNILSDFNKHWFRLLNGKNEFSINGNCSIELEYREIRKVGVGI